MSEPALSKRYPIVHRVIQFACLLSFWIQSESCALPPETEPELTEQTERNGAGHEHGCWPLFCDSWLSLDLTHKFDFMTTDMHDRWALLISAIMALGADRLLGRLNIKSLSTKLLWNQDSHDEKKKFPFRTNHEACLWRSCSGFIRFHKFTTSN